MKEKKNIIIMWQQSNVGRNRNDNGNNVGEAEAEIKHQIINSAKKLMFLIHGSPEKWNNESHGRLMKTGWCNESETHSCCTNSSSSVTLCSSKTPQPLWTPPTAERQNLTTAWLKNRKGDLGGLISWDHQHLQYISYTDWLSLNWSEMRYCSTSVSEGWNQTDLSCVKEVQWIQIIQNNKQ